MTSNVLPPCSAKVTVVERTLVTFLIRTDEARVRCRFEVRAEERHSIGFELQTGTCPRHAHPSHRNAGTSHRLRHPPLPEQLGLGPRLEHEARRPVDGSGHDELTLGRPFHRRVVPHGSGLSLADHAHRPSPFDPVPRRPCPTRRSVRPRVGGTIHPCRLILQAGGPSVQVRTRRLLRPDEPGLLKDADGFLMPVRVMWSVRARRRSNESARLSSSRTPRRVAPRARRTNHRVGRWNTDPYGSVYTDDGDARGPTKTRGSTDRGPEPTLPCVGDGVRRGAVPRLNRPPGLMAPD